MRALIRILPLTLLLSLPSPMSAGFRSFEAIPTPPLSPGEAVELVPVPPDLAEDFLHRLFRSWNTAQLDDLLSDRFRDRERLLHAIAAKAPPDARLRVLAIQGIQLLSQDLRDDALVSLMSARVRAQVEFNHPELGFQRREGTAEYVFTLVRRVP